MKIQRINNEKDPAYYAASFTQDGVKHVVFGSSFVELFREVWAL
jgi:hypothetical protein